VVQVRRSILLWLVCTVVVAALVIAGLVRYLPARTASAVAATATVSLDHPQPVHLNLQGSSQLEVSCSAINTTTQATEYMDVALGNATIGPS
jgi:hypothetical protein